MNIHVTLKTRAMIDRDTSSMNMVRYYQQYNTVYIGILLWDLTQGYTRAELTYVILLTYY